MATSKEVCTEVVFGETSLLRAPGGNEEGLAASRRFIAGVVYKRYEGHQGRFAPRQHPSDSQLKDPQIKKHWDLCNQAAHDAIKDDVGACQHFIISWLNGTADGPSADDPAIQDPWPINEKDKINATYGPFTRVSRKDIFVFKYCGVRLFFDDQIQS